MHRRAIIAALLGLPIAACERGFDPTLAMRFAVTQEALEPIGAALSAYAARNGYKFEQGADAADRFFSLYNERVRIEMAPGAWIDPPPGPHEWPYEYQIHFFRADTSIDVETLAAEIGELLSAVPGVQKSGPNFYWQQIVPKS